MNHDGGFESCSALVGTICALCAYLVFASYMELISLQLTANWNTAADEKHYLLLV